MRMRSLLFVPGDSEKKLARSVGLHADVLVLDLEDSVATPHKELARALVREYLAGRQMRDGGQVWVRINPLDSPLSLADLVAIVGARPDGIVQPKIRSPRDVVRLSHYLDVLEAQHGIVSGAIRILPVATETAEAVFSLGGFASCDGRLAGLTWGAEDLGAAVGAITNKGPDGAWTAPYQLVRSLCLFAAHAAGVLAIDTLYADIRNEAGLRAACEEARRDGFNGKIAIHPDQVPVINACFMPTEEEIARARRIVALFDASPAVGAVAMDGQMLDIPHLRQAQRILSMAGAVQG